MFLKGLLGEAVECQRGHGAFETRSGHAPRAVGAAPAGEVVAFDPDQSFVHTSTSFMVALGLELGGEGGTHQCASAEGLLPIATGNFARKFHEAK